MKLLRRNLQSYMGLAALSLCLFFSTAQAQSVTALTCSPAIIGGGTGTPSICTVKLGTAAPAGGTVVTLVSSLTELAASVPAITVPSGQNSMNFTVGTNAKYRRYSKLAFKATITATTSATSKSAVLDVTAQALPTDSVISPRADRSGAVCAGEAGILFNCPLGSAQCTVKQECTLGCENRPLSGNTYKDVCATAGPVPLALNPKRLIGGNPGAGTLQLATAATAGSYGKVYTDSLVAAETTRMTIPIAKGATSKPISLITAAVNGINFAPMDATVVIPKVSGGSTFYQARSARTWLAVAPGTPPAVSLLSLGLESSSLVGGQVTFGTTCVNQLAPAPVIGSITLALSSSHPAAAVPSPAQATLTQGSDCVSFSVQTSAVATNTTVTIGVQLGAQLLSVPLLVTATPAATEVISFFLDPLIVTGGQASQATLVLDGMAPSGGFLITLSSDNAAVVTLPTSVTVPSGADRISFSIGTTAVTANVLVNLLAKPSTGLFPQLQVRAP